MNRLRTEIEKHVDRKNVRELLARLLQTPSYWTPLMEKEPMVLNFTKEVVFRELRDVGLKDIIIDRTGNLIARIKTKKNGPRVLYVAYAMTGELGTMKEPFSGKILDGRSLGLKGEFVWGRGANEQKGSLGAMITALKVLTELGVEPCGEVTLVVSTAGETGTHDSLRQVIEVDGVRADRAIVSGEYNKIQIANKGRLDIIITVKGRGTHTRTPWEGVDAIQGMFAVYEKVKPLIPYPNKNTHQFLGRATLIPMGLESFPRDSHTVQEKCILTLDRRLLPGENPKSAFPQIADTIGSVEPYEVSVESGPYLLPSEVSPDATVVKDLMASIRTVGADVPELEHSHAAYDAGYLNHKGIETVRYGAGNHYFPARYGHSDRDVVSVEETIDVAKALAAMALKGVDL